MGVLGCLAFPVTQNVSYTVEPRYNEMRYNEFLLYRSKCEF